MVVFTKRRLAISVVLVLFCGLLLDAQRRVEKVTRAKLPQASASNPDSPFFDNAFDKLKGVRTISSGVVASKNGGSSGTDNSPTPGASLTLAWSAMISPETIEDEVKSLKLK